MLNNARKILCMVWVSCAMLRAHRCPAQETPDAGIPPAYCGVQCISYASSILKRPVPLAALVKKEYISSKVGSSVEDLLRAASDFGLNAKALGRMSVFHLRESACPVVLHVKRDLSSPAYDHWILFVGIDNGKIKVYDGRRFDLISPSALSARWDGTGILISDRELDSTRLALVSLTEISWYAGTAFCLGAVAYLARRALAPLRGAPALFGETIVLLALAALLAGAVHSLTGAGLLENEDAVLAIRETHYAQLHAKVTVDQIRGLVGVPGVTVVDARLVSDFNRGHLPGAINIPPDSPPDLVARLTESLPEDNQFIIYCQSSACPFSERVARKLESLGRRNIAIFREGWAGWQRARQK